MKLNNMLKKATIILMSCTLAISPIWAAQIEAKPVLDLQKAIDMAIGRDDNLAKYTRNIKVYTEQRDGISDISATQYSSKQIDIQQSEQNKLFRKDAIAKEVTDDYQNAILLEKNIALLAEQISLNEKLVNQAKIKKEKGFSDELTYEKAVQALESAKVNKEQAEKNLEDAKKSFLKLTNLNLDKYTLEMSEEYKPLILDKTIGEYASGMATELTKYTKQKAELNEEGFWDNIYQSGPEGGGPTYMTYLEQKANVDNAKDSAKSAYDTYKLLIETKYTSLNAQLDTIKTKTSDYDTSIKDMKILEIKYKAGYVSAIDYETQKVALDTKQVEYLEAVYKYNSLRMQVEKPWVMNEYSV